MNLIRRCFKTIVLLLASQALFSQEIDTALLARIASTFERGNSLEIDYQYGFINCWGISEAQKKNWSILHTFLKYLEENKSVKIAILSHTNCSGNEEYNKQLTKVRAQNMKTWFLKRGISTMRINPIGMGGEQPIIDCTERKNRFAEFETNERIEIRRIGREKTQ